MNHSINSFNIACHLWSQSKWSSLMLVLPFWTLSTHWYTFFCVIQFFSYCINFFCESGRVLPPWTTKIKWQHNAQWKCSLKAELTCLHYDCTSFTEHNSYPMTLAQYVVCVMPAKAQSDKLPGFYMQITFSFWIPCLEINKEPYC
jgi:hypothetical protein